MKPAQNDGLIFYALFLTWAGECKISPTQRSYNRFLRRKGPVWSAMETRARHDRRLRDRITDAEQERDNRKRGVYVPKDDATP